MNGSERRNTANETTGHMLATSIQNEVTAEGSILANLADNGANQFAAHRTNVTVRYACHCDGVDDVMCAAH